MLDGMYSEYLEDLKRVVSADDELFPDFLFSYIANDFGDNYYQQGLAETPVLREAKKLRRKYNDFFDYIDAMEAYHEYMDVLIEKYGSKRIIKTSAKQGMLEDFVPPKPKLKNNRRNRAMMACGIVPSRQVCPSAPPGRYTEVAREVYPEITGDGIDEEHIWDKPPKRIRKLFKKSAERMNSASRKNNMYRASMADNNQIDFIIDWINGAKTGKHIDIDTYYSADGERSIVSIMKEDMEDKYIPEEIRNDRDFINTSTLVNGKMMKAREYQKVEIMTALYEMGINVFDSYGKYMDKKAVKMIRSNVGNGPMTKKEKKRAKKNAKREKKRLENKRNNDMLMDKIMFQNRFSFAEEGDPSSVSFHLSDLVRGE